MIPSLILFSFRLILNFLHRAPIPNQSSSNTTTITQQQLMNRPSSAYYNSNNNATQNSNIPYGMSLSGQHPNQQSQMMRPGPSNAKPANVFMRDAQAQQSLRLMQNQMMAPSMPNIAHSSGYATNIHSANSQSMQNVNTITGPPTVQPPINFQNGQYIPGYVSPPEHPHANRMNAGGGVTRVGQLQKPSHSNSMEQIAGYQMGGYGPGMHHSPQKIMGPPAAQQQQQYARNRTMSPMKSNQLPMTAPKPHRHDMIDTPPLPPTSTHPLYKTAPVQQTSFNYVASSNEPPKVGLYPNQNVPNQGHAKLPSSGNPWEREEREKEQEIRREQIRMWRDQQISDLSSIPNRNQQQEEQLKTLLLERDFERRAIEEQAEEESEEKYAKENVQEVLRLANQTRKSVEIRTPTNAVAITTTTIDTVTTATTTRVTQISDTSVSPTTPPLSTHGIQPKSILKHNAAGVNPASPSKQQNKTATFIDKSLNLTEITMNNTNANQMMSQLGKLNLNEEFEPTSPGLLQLQHHQHQHENNVETMPPPPPERNSSYLIMAQQQKFRAQQQNLLNNNTATTPKQSPGNYSQFNNNNVKNSQNNNTSGGVVQAEIAFATTTNPPTTGSLYNSKIDNKRVSFHDEDNGNVMVNVSAVETTTSVITNAGSGIEQAELAIIREDPNVSL